MAVMQTEFKHFVDAPKEALYAYLQKNPQAMVLQEQIFELDQQYQLVSLDVSLQEGMIPLSIEMMEGLSYQSTMAEVYETLSKDRRGAVYIYAETDHDARLQTTAKTDNQIDTSVHGLLHNHRKVVGIITWSMLHRYLLRQQY
jgi:hypothetical protein